MARGEGPAGPGGTRAAAADAGRSAGNAPQTFQNRLWRVRGASRTVYSVPLMATPAVPSRSKGSRTRAVPLTGRGQLGLTRAGGSGQSVHRLNLSHRLGPGAGVLVAPPAPLL